MDNKKVFLSLLLVFLIALSVSSVSAEDAADAIASVDSEDAVAVDDVVADVQEESAIEEPLAARTISPGANTSEAISTVISSAIEGDTIDLGVFETYDVSDSSFDINVADITIKGNGNTVIKGYGAGNGIFNVIANGVTIQGIVFIDTNPDSVLTYYDDATKNDNVVKGWGVRFFGASNGVVDNCTFIDFNHGVRIQKQANNIVVKNPSF